LERDYKVNRSGYELEGKGTVLETMENLENLNFAELKSHLELLFGEGNLTLLLFPLY